jgi:hypothetical protein
VRLPKPSEASAELVQPHLHVLYNTTHSNRAFCRVCIKKTAAAKFQSARKKKVTGGMGDYGEYQSPMGEFDGDMIDGAAMMMGENKPRILLMGPRRSGEQSSRRAVDTN